MLGVDLVSLVLPRHLKHVPGAQPARRDRPLAADQQEDGVPIATEELLVEHEALGTDARLDHIDPSWIAYSRL